MLKKIFLILFSMFFSFCFAQPLQGEIKYNEATAKTEAFYGVDKKIDKNLFKDYLKDANWRENMESIENKIVQIENRTLCPFYIKNTLITYAVSYEDVPLRVFYYNILGNLVKVDIIEKETFPRKTLGYSRRGRLLNAAFEVDGSEQFIYDSDGKLIAHWLGRELLDKKTGFFKITRMP